MFWVVGQVSGQTWALALALASVLALVLVLALQLLQTRSLFPGQCSWERNLHIDRHREVVFANQLGFYDNPTLLMPSRS